MTANRVQMQADATALAQLWALLGAETQTEAVVAIHKLKSYLPKEEKEK